MLGFVQNWFATPTDTIGVDFGSDSLRMAQVEMVDGEFKLIAAAAADVPSNARNDVPARIAFYAEGLRDLLSQGAFKGRRAILSLPASLTYYQHVRMPRMDDDAMKKALLWELRGKLPVDPSQMALRHIVAGDVYQDQDPKSEVIVMAAKRDIVDQLLNAASKARLDVAGMNVEPKAIIDCFTHVYRRKSDAEAVTCYLDIGCNSSRAVIAVGTQIRFARVIQVGGEHFTRAVASYTKLPVEKARTLRFQNSAAAPNAEESKAVEAAAPAPDDDRRIQNEFALLGAALSAAQKHQSPAQSANQPSPTPPVTDQQQQIADACREPMMKLVDELALCRRYYEATFQNQPLDRLIFLGGEARQRTLCQAIAREMGVAAQIGDPMARMSRTCELGVESGIDRRLPQPAWAVAIGLSMGPVMAEQAAAKK